MCGVLFWNLPAYAKIYKWVDEQGKVHYTNDPTQLPQDEGAEIETFRELRSPPAQKEEPEEQVSKTQTIPLHDEEDSVKPDMPVPPKPKVKIEAAPKTIAEQKESYRKLLEKARDSRNRQLKKIADLQEMDEKPKDWTTKESLEEIIEGLKTSVKKLEKDILKYENKIKSTKLTD